MTASRQSVQNLEKKRLPITAVHIWHGGRPDGGAEHWAVLASLIETCKRNDVDPQAYLADALAKIVNRHAMSRIDELLPFAYVKNTPEKAVA